MNYKKIIILLLLCLPIGLSASNYYVKIGASGDTLTAISQVNALTLVAGDSVFFNRGDVWRETLDLSASGTSSNNIYYGAYGTGNNPRIFGSNITTWDNVSGNIWKSNSTFATPRGAEVFFDLSGTITWGAYPSMSHSR